MLVGGEIEPCCSKPDVGRDTAVCCSTAVVLVAGEMEPCCSKPDVGRDTEAVVGRDTAVCCSTPGVLETEWAGIAIGNAKLVSTPGIVREIADECWLGKGRPVFVAA